LRHSVASGTTTRRRFPRTATGSISAATDPGGFGGIDLWAAHRHDKNDDFGWETPINLGSTINSLQNDDGPTYFEDENGTVSLYFTSLQRPGGLGDWDIYVSHATSDDHLSFGPVTLVNELSSPRRDTRTSIRRDGLETFITSNRVGSVPDATGAPSLDIWVSTRSSTADPWSTPVNLGAPINTPANDGAPSLSFDGTTLYFDSTRSGGFGMRDLYVSKRAKVHGSEAIDVAAVTFTTDGAGAEKPGQFVSHREARPRERYLHVAMPDAPDGIWSSQRSLGTWER
jgi:hypothetical protein